MSSFNQTFWQSQIFYIEDIISFDMIFLVLATDSLKRWIWKLDFLKKKRKEKKKKKVDIKYQYIKYPVFDKIYCNWQWRTTHENLFPCTKLS